MTSLTRAPQARLMNSRLPRLAGLACLGLIAIGSLLCGPVELSPLEVMAAIGGQADEITNTIVRELRVPRLLLTVGIGGMLGLAGAALQGYLRNPLAEPAILGTSNAAALGAVVAMHFGLYGSATLMMPLMSGGFALIAMAALFAFALTSPSPLTLVLTGIAVSSLTGAGISLVLNMSPNPFAATEVAFWLLGSVEGRSMQHVLIAVPMMLVGALMLIWDGRALDALSLGDESARTMGISLMAVQARLIAGVSLGVGAAVAVAGSIGFVGLVAPHLVRGLGANAPSRTLLPSAFMGAILLTSADILVRLLPTSNELKLGVVTALIGAPFLVAILHRSRVAAM